MNILVIRLSSMGDLIQTFPAITDLKKNFPNAKIDWVVDDCFKEIPSWHPAIRRVISLPLRQLKKNFLHPTRWLAVYRTFKILRAEKYDVICDAQGLIKSALIAFFMRGISYGLDWQSAREPLASLFYRRKITVPKNEQSPLRTRQLLARAFHYDISASPVDYGLTISPGITEKTSEKTIVFLHGTTWPTKHWPDNHWISLANTLAEKGYSIQLPCHTESENQRAQKIAATHKNAVLLPRLNLNEIKLLLQRASAVVSLDTGLGHLSAALNTPTIFLYGPTNPKVTGGIYKEKQLFLTSSFACAPCLRRTCQYDHSALNNPPPCFNTVTAKLVVEKIESLLC